MNNPLPYRELLSLIAIVLTFYSFYPYLRSILRGTTRPHAFSWIIWAISTFVVFLAQLADGGGAGAWPIGASGLITLWVAVLAWRNKGDIDISALDWLFLVLALSALPLWYATTDPFWAVVVLTTIDALGFGPTFRKIWHHPWQENLTFYFLFAVRNLIAIAALAHLSWTTVLFPAAIGLACLVFIATTAWRRRVMGRNRV